MMIFRISLDVVSPRTGQLILLYFVSESDSGAPTRSMQSSSVVALAGSLVMTEPAAVTDRFRFGSVNSDSVVFVPPRPAGG